MSSTIGSTTATFTINSGTLSITVPGAVNLGIVQTGSTAVTALLGLVQVTDLRASTAGDLDHDCLVDQLRHRRGTPAETVPASDVIYDPGAAVSTTGTALWSRHRMARFTPYRNGPAAP